MNANGWLIGLCAGLIMGSAAGEELPGSVKMETYIEGQLGSVTQTQVEALDSGPVYGGVPYPLYTSELAPGEGRDLVLGNCSLCHSVTYITMQPPREEQAWEATVKKMIEKFGAPIPADTAQQIVGYLQAHYAPETRKP
jgi:mono/diheme cytochrome c family protein